jgi:hypothetical protein
LLAVILPDPLTIKNGGQRSQNYTDGLVIIENGKNLEAGEFARVRVTSAGEHDLWADQA